MGNVIEASTRFSQPERSYLVGRDQEGYWVAVDSRGLGGGIFRSREAAEDFAAFETDHRPGAVRVTADRVSLSLAA